MHGFLDSLKQRVLVFDGAMGTQVQALDLELDAYLDQEGNTDILSLTRRDDLAGIYERYYSAGADCVETNTFGANVVVQADYENDAETVMRMNVDSARIAREVASGFEGKFVVGSMGPGTRSPTLGQATFDELAASYRMQAEGLIEGGVDALIVETVFDVLQAKSAMAGIMDAFSASGRRVPVICQVTIETTGTMLLGTEMSAAIATLEPYSIIDVLGINCATGPEEMTEHVRTLTQRSRRPVSVQPNAGLPVMRDGAACYDLTPEQLLDAHRVFVGEFGAQIVGGCCGTTPEHIRVLSEGIASVTPAVREIEFEPAATSLYQASAFKQESSVFVIGERCNAQGSRAFKALVEAGSWDDTLEVAKSQVADGAHALDVSVDFTGRDGVADMIELADRFRTQVTLPLVFDSTEPEVIEAGLKRYGGRAVINSINLEEGRGEDTRLERNLRAAVRYGSAVVALAIDEEGQATTAEWKVRVSTRLFDIATQEYGLEPSSIIFDPIVLPISTGMEETRRAGIETLDAIGQLKERFPESFTSLGVSNVSFGLNAAARQVLNSVFLHEATERGLNAAIVHAGQILPRARIDDEAYELALALIYDRRSDGIDPLGELVDYFRDATASKGADAETLATLPLDERLVRRITDAAKKGLTQDLDEALQGRSALDILNGSLLEGMRIVGERFASGEMQLPFVLQSAETMKAAVAHLEPHMDRIEGEQRGTIVLATVKGDVHDIGKNLVDIIFTNNGYRVVNLGIKMPVNQVIDAVKNEKADAIGLSGLLVKSTIVMREDLEELNRRGLSDLPVLLGGAALTRTYVEHDLRKIYQGQVFYGKDAFEGLGTMEALMEAKRGGASIDYAVKEKRVPTTNKTVAKVAKPREPLEPAEVPKAPFLGSRVVKGIDVLEVSKYLNRTALFRGQWQLKPVKGESKEDYNKRLELEAEPELRRLLAWSQAEQILQPAVVYGFFEAHSEGNALIVKGAHGAERFEFPRQARDRQLCIADFFKPKSEAPDVVAFHLVTMGGKIADEAAKMMAAGEYQEYLYAHGFGVEMAEALAEMWHARIRAELKIAAHDADTPQGLFRQGYQGSRYSFGYPACPNLEDQEQLFRLLNPSRIGVELSEEFQLHPEQSTSAIIVHHPAARYFSV